MTLSILWPFKRSTFARMTAAILLGMEAARLSSSCTWMLDQVLAISPFSSTRLVGQLLLMRLFIMFHTSPIMFKSGLLAGQSSTWTLCSCSHVLTFLCAEAWGVCRSQMLLKNHIFIAIQMHTDPLWIKQSDSLTLPYTSTRQKIRIFWKIAITFLTLAQNTFNYSKRFNVILEINEFKLVHNYGNFNYKYMYF